MLENWPAIISSVVFTTVIILIMTEWIHLTIIALLGALALVFSHVMTLGEAIDYIGRSHGTLGLFFGVMVMVRAFEPTKIFDYLAVQMVLLAKGKGRNLLLGITAITAPICGILPNTAAMMLLAPLLPPMAADIGVDFVPLLMLMVFVANSAGLLTLVGSPATYIVGDAINITFGQYMQRLSLGGVISIIAILVMLPWLFPKIWRTELDNLDKLPHPQINHPRTLAFGSLIIGFVLIFFVIGESLPYPIEPATVALGGAALSLLLAHHSKIDTVSHILRDVDWSTLIFFMSIFVIIGSLEQTGVISNISGILSLVLGKNIPIASLVILFVVGLISSVVPNIPLVVTMVPLLKEYIINIGMAAPEILSPNYTGQLNPVVLPLFYAMLYGATLGGNGTLAGASTNIVAAGIAELHGKKISFKRFLRYGIPVMLMQLATSSIYITVAFLL